MSSENLEHGSTSVTAHDRLKAQADARVYKSLILATLVHFLVLIFGPDFDLPGYRSNQSEIRVVRLAPGNTVTTSPPAEEIPRPAAPVISDPVTDFDEIDVESITFDVDTSLDALPEPAVATADPTDIAAAPAYTPFTVPPRVLNRREIYVSLTASYRRHKARGSVVVWFFVDEHGMVRNALIKEPSRFQTLNDVALEIATLMRFAPAQNRGKPVPVWVAMPIAFIAR